MHFSYNHTYDIHKNLTFQILEFQLGFIIFISHKQPNRTNQTTWIIIGLSFLYLWFFAIETWKGNYYGVRFKFYHILKKKKTYKITLSFLYLLIIGLCSWCSPRFIYDGFGLFHCRNLEKSFRSYGAFLTTRFPWLGAFQAIWRRRRR